MARERARERKGIKGAESCSELTGHSALYEIQK